MPVSGDLGVKATNIHFYYTTDSKSRYNCFTVNLGRGESLRTEGFGDHRLIRTQVFAADKSTQFPSTLEDLLGDSKPKILWAHPREKRTDPVLPRLIKGNQAIQESRRRLQGVKLWLEHHSERSERYWEYKRTEELERERLRRYQDEFWELNVPDPEARIKERLADEVRYKAWILQIYRKTDKELREDQAVPRAPELPVRAGLRVSSARTFVRVVRGFTSLHPVKGVSAIDFETTEWDQRLWTPFPTVSEE